MGQSSQGAFSQGFLVSVMEMTDPESLGPRAGVSSVHLHLQRFLWESHGMGTM